MNKSNIIEWMDNPASVNEDATRALREIIQEFPASPILHWLYLKGLQNQKSYLFNSALSRAAIGSPNRTQLLEWVGLEQQETDDSKKQRFEFVIPDIEKEPEVEVKVAPTVVEENKAEALVVVEEEVKTIPVIEEKKPEPKIEVPRPPKRELKKKAPSELPDDIKALLEKSKRIRTGYNEVHSADVEETKEASVEPVLEQPEVKVEETTSGLVEPLIEQPEVKVEEVKEEPEGIQIQEEIVPEVILAPVEPIEEKVEEAPFSSEEPKAAEEETYFSIDLGAGIEDEGALEEESNPETIEVENSFSIELEDYTTQEEEPKVDTKSPKPKEVLQNRDADFTSWLKTLKPEKPESEIKPEPELILKSEPVSKPKAPKEEISFELLTDVVPSKLKKVDLVKEKKIELIDKFLEERPKINPRKEDFSLLNIADNPESSDNQFVTETLAKVYLAQGHLNKAIEAYEILGLKYPEKNSFFDDRIRDIKRRK